MSNSSWANVGYLVASDINKEPDFLKELERLAVAHGIGIIEINKKQMADSRVVFPAKARVELDWNTIDLLVEHNVDFKEFIDDIRKILITKDSNIGKWNDIEDYESLMNNHENT